MSAAEQRLGPATGVPPFPPPGFRLLWSAELVSTFGSYVTLLALQTLVVLTLDGDAQDVGWLSAARWLPYLVMGLVVGALVDRWPRRPVLIGADLTRAVLLCTVPAAWALEALSLPLVLGVVLVFGTISLVGDAAHQSFVPRLVPAVHLQRAHARLDSADAVAQSGGPALAGLLIAAVGPPLAVLLDAATYLYSAASISRLRVVEAPAPPPSDHEVAARPGRLRREIVEGVRWVYRTSGLARLAISTHIWFAGNAVVIVVIAPFALLVLGLSPLQLGLASAAAGAGAVLGTLVTTTVGLRIGTAGAIIASRVLSLVGALVMALAGVGTGSWSAAAVLAAGQLVYGFGLGISNSHEMAYRQLLTPDGLQARTNTTMRSINRGVVVVGAPLAGLLASSVGTEPALVVAAAIFAVSIAVLALSPFPSVRVVNTPTHAVPPPQED